MRLAPAPMTDPCRTLDIRRLARAGDLQPDCRSFRQGGAGEEAWQLALQTDRADEDGRPNLLTVIPLVHRGEPAGSVGEAVKIAWTPCTYGGARPWFICPGPMGDPACGRRTAILYLPIGRAGGWCCRSCLRLRYLSTVESERLRNIGQLGKLYARLGGAEWLHGPLPDKPRGMHLETYERILAAIDARKRAHIEIVTSRLRHKV